MHHLRNLIPLQEPERLHVCKNPPSVLLSYTPAHPMQGLVPSPHASQPRLGLLCCLRVANFREELYKVTHMKM